MKEWDIQILGAKPKKLQVLKKTGIHSYCKKCGTSWVQSNQNIMSFQKHVIRRVLLQDTSTTSKSIEELESRAVASERRVAHISSLLSEAELENSRLSELATVLKEEIRSYQRSEERSKHIENLEYVKNIIVKVQLLQF